MPSLKPSTPQLNEGESLSTLLEGFTPNSTLYYKVIGSRGFNKKDLAAGAVKGSLKVDANGVASIAHTLKADKKTEGAESFTIQVFSDKKMRNLVGQSDAVGVGDTSVKAAKGSGGNGGGGRDSVTGMYVDIDGMGRIESDKVYDRNSPLGRAYLSAANPAYVDALIDWSIEVEFGTGQFVVMTQKATLNRGGFIQEQVSRDVTQGEFVFRQGKLVSGRVDFTADADANNSAEEGGIQSFGGIPLRTPLTARGLFPSTLYGNEGTVISRFSIVDGQLTGNPQMSREFGGGQFFQEGWWLNPFATNLIA